MAVTVTNVSGMVLPIRLRSGATLRLRPGKQTDALADAEVRDNPRVDTLEERGLVRIDPVLAASAPPAEDAGAAAAPAESTGAGGGRRSSPRASGSRAVSSA
jgi:hypothetical protein